MKYEPRSHYASGWEATVGEATVTVLAPPTLGADEQESMTNHQSEASVGEATIFEAPSLEPEAANGSRHRFLELGKQWSVTTLRREKNKGPFRAEVVWGIFHVISPDGLRKS